MEKTYLIVVEFEGVRYLQLTEHESNYRLCAYETKEEAIDVFTSFKNKVESTDYETHISGSLGILNIKPHIIAVDKDNPEFVKPYLLNQHPTKIEGRFFGGYVDMVGVEVTEDILMHSVYDVAYEFIKGLRVQNK